MQANFVKALINFLAPSMRSPSGITGWVARSLMRKSNPMSTEYAIKNRLNLQTNDVFVELGAGEGAGLKAVMNGVKNGGAVPSRVVLVEISEDFRASLRELLQDPEIKVEEGNPPNIEIREEDCKSMLYLEDCSVDKIFGMNVVYFLDPLPEYLREIYRVLKVDGSVTFCCKFKALPQDSDVFVNVKEEDIVQKMKQAGFEVSSEAVTVSETETMQNYLEIKGTRKRA